MPAERLWPLTNEGVANRFFEGIEELEEALVEALRRVRRSGQGHTRSHKLPLVAPSRMTFQELFSRIRYYSSGESTNAKSSEPIGASS